MYKALYRRYRPKNFKELLGQDHITTTLKNQIKNDNIGHAYLFSGTRGTGKTSAAKILARAVNCLDSEDGEPCNKCRNCLEILAETTVDVVEMDAASNNKVDDVRELREKVIYPPTNIKKKVYIIDEVHMLTNQAFNALLKTLEEPPKHLIFILATTEPERLPQTILSRCQRFDFKRIQSGDIVRNMRMITEELEVEVEDDVLALIARNSDGAMRDALSLLDQCVSFSEDHIKYEDAIELLGITNSDIIFELVDNIIEKNLEDSLNTLDEINASGKDINQLVKDLIGHFRNLMIVKSSKEPGSIIEIDNIERFKEQCESISIEFILRSINILIDAETKGKWSGEVRLILEMAIIKMLDIEKDLSLEDRIKRLEEGFVVKKDQVEEVGSKKTSDQSSKADPVEKAPVKDPVKSEEKSEGQNFTDLDLQTIQSHWDAILKKIKSEKISLYALTMEGKLKSFENNQLEINYDEEFGFHHSAVSKEDNKKFVEEIISKYFNVDMVISFSIGGMDLKPQEEESDDKAIEKVVEFFGEDIVEIK